MKVAKFRWPFGLLYWSNGDPKIPGAAHHVFWKIYPYIGKKTPIFFRPSGAMGKKNLSR